MVLTLVGIWQVTSGQKDLLSPFSLVPQLSHSPLPFAQGWRSLFQAHRLVEMSQHCSVAQAHKQIPLQGEEGKGQCLTRGKQMRVSAGKDGKD